MFSHDPPTGVYSGMIPCSNSQQTNAGVLCPARLSSTSSIRKGRRLGQQRRLDRQAVLPAFPGLSRHLGRRGLPNRLSCVIFAGDKAPSPVGNVTRVTRPIDKDHLSGGR